MVSKDLPQMRDHLISAVTSEGYLLIYDLRSNVQVAEEFIGKENGLSTAMAKGYLSELYIGTKRGILLSFDLRMNLVESRLAYKKEC